MVRRRHRAEVHQVRPRAVQCRGRRRRRCGRSARETHRCTAFASGSSSRSAGHRDVSGMIARHAAIARELGAQLGLPDAVLDALAGCVRALGRPRLARQPGGRPDPIASRVGAAGGIRGSRAPRRRRRRGGGDRRATTCHAVRPGARRRRSVSTRRRSWGAIDDAGSWDAVIDAEPSLAVALTDAECDDALRRSLDFVDLKSPYTVGHSARSPSWPPPPVASSVSNRATC